MEIENKANEDLITCIYNAEYEKAKKIVFNNNVNLNYVKKNGQTALLVAINKENLDIINFLLKYGANVNFSNTYILPLERIIENAGNIMDFAQTNIVDENSIKIIKLLLEHGADPYLKDKEGETPTDFLERYFGYDNFKEFLEDYDTASKITP